MGHSWLSLYQPALVADENKQLGQQWLSYVRTAFVEAIRALKVTLFRKFKTDNILCLVKGLVAMSMTSAFGERNSHFCVPLIVGITLKF